MPATRPMAGSRYANNTYGTMQREMMSKAKTQRLDRFLASTSGSVTLVLLTVMVAAGALTTLFGLSLNLPLFLLSGFVLTLLRIIAALSARVLLRQNTRTLRFFSALTALLIGLNVISIITRGAVGVSLTPRYLASPNWAGLIQVFWSSLVTWLTLNAWSKPIRLKEKTASAQKKIKARKPRGSRPSVSRTQFKMPRIKMPFSFLKNNRTGKYSGIRSGTINWPSKHKRVPGQWVRLSKAVLKRPSKKFRLRRCPEPVKLIGVVEHKCPFCLESVVKNDPRGLKICSSCKTWHHADCWDMTGECQVPHQN